RTGHHAAGDFQATLLTVRQRTRRAVGEGFEVDRFKPVLGVFHGLAFAFAIRRGLEQAGQEVGVEVTVLGNQQVFHRGHFLEQTHVLE
nr:hypothetical protein [Tanacetum cinerariifolium]